MVNTDLVQMEFSAFLCWSIDITRLCLVDSAEYCLLGSDLQINLPLCYYY